MEQKLCLNLGSGQDYKNSTKEEKWINIDRFYTTKTDLSIDFIKNKLPYKDKSVDYVICKNLLPHINYRDFYKIIREVYRVLKVGGIFYVNAIHFSSRLSCEPAHTQGYSARFLIEILSCDIDIEDYYKFI